jgi:hypothetical protein
VLSEEPRDLFGPYVDDELEPDIRAHLEAALTDDADLRQDFDDYCESVSMLRGLPAERPPDRFILLVQQRIRRRSRGRHFSFFRRPRTFIVEAAVCAVLIFVMAALYLFGHKTPALPDAGSNEVRRVTLAPADKRVLKEFGRIDTIGTSITGDDLIVKLNVPLAREPALLETLNMHPRMSLETTSRFLRGGRVWLSVRARPGPQTTIW